MRPRPPCPTPVGAGKSVRSRSGDVEARSASVVNGSACRVSGEVRGSLGVVVSLIYWALRRLLELLILRTQSERAKEIEILVLRHQLQVLGRQVARPQLRPADRALLAAFSRVLPRAAWPSFLVTPATLLRWHRELGSRSKLNRDRPISGASPASAEAAVPLRCPPEAWQRQLLDQPSGVRLAAMLGSHPRATICGLDEAGRGALAGPLVLAAVVLDATLDFRRLDLKLVVRDSKLLSTRQRAALHEVIVSHALTIETEVLSVKEINERGINWANIEGFRRLIARTEADLYIVDGRWSLGDLGVKQPSVSCQIKADEVVPAALAAGVVAKVRRDEIMSKLDLESPAYGWASNTGHGTAAHVEAIKLFGACRHHRSQFVATALRPPGQSRRRSGVVRALT